MDFADSNLGAKKQVPEGLEGYGPTALLSEFRQNKQAVKTLLSNKFKSRSCVDRLRIPSSRQEPSRLGATSGWCFCSLVQQIKPTLLVFLCLFSNTHNFASRQLNNNKNYSSCLAEVCLSPCLSSPSLVSCTSPSAT